MTIASHRQDAVRLESWAGEVRLNLIRAAALFLLYAAHLIDIALSPRPSAEKLEFHHVVTSLVVGWALATGILHACLVRRFVPAALKYVVTGFDLVAITLLVALSPDGPRSYLVILYFLVLAGAPLRQSMALVRTTTFAAMGGYLVVLGEYAWMRVGFEDYYVEGPHRIPRAQQAVIVLSLGAAGLIAGQIVRQCNRIVGRQAVVVADETQYPS